MEEDEFLATLSLVVLGIAGGMCAVAACFKVRRETQFDNYGVLDIV